MKIDGNKAIPYMTKEFDTWEKSVRISLKQAFKIHYEYVLKNFDDVDRNTFKGYGLSYAYEDFHVFSTITNVQKLGVFNLTGIWVNAESGEAKYVRLSRDNSFNTEGFLWKIYLGTLSKS